MGAEIVLSRAKRNLIEKEEKKRKNKKSEVTFVGIHNRRGDHIQYQKEGNFKSIEPSYFIEAMDLYRQEFRKVVFIYVSDNVDWGKKRLLPRVKTGDLYFVDDILHANEAESVPAQGRD